MVSSAVRENQLEKPRWFTISMSTACSGGDSTAIAPFNLSTSSKKMKQNMWNVEPKTRLKIPETVRRELKFGARIVREGGVQKIFKGLFSVEDEERLLKVCQCSLSTIVGPVPGFLFISTHKVAFCSEKSITIAPHSKGAIRIHYKVSIPKQKVGGVNESSDSQKRSRKYLQVVTVDGFEFWFMGLLNFQNAVKCLHQALFRASYG